MYYQKLEGHLDPRVWLGVRSADADIIAYPGAQGLVAHSFALVQP